MIYFPFGFFNIFLILSFVDIFVYAFEGVGTPKLSTL